MVSVFGLAAAHLPRSVLPVLCVLLLVLLLVNNGLPVRVQDRQTLLFMRSFPWSESSQYLLPPFKPAADHQWSSRWQWWRQRKKRTGIPMKLRLLCLGLSHWSVVLLSLSVAGNIRFPTLHSIVPGSLVAIVFPLVSGVYLCGVASTASCAPYRVLIRAGWLHCRWWTLKQIVCA